LQSAAMKNDYCMVQRLLRLGADANAPANGTQSKTALQWAVENGNIKLCQVLLGAGAELNATPTSDSYPRMKTTTLAAAVSSQNHQLVELFLKYGADVNDERGTETTLETAVMFNDEAMTKLLLLAEADVTVGHPIIFAAQNRNRRLILMLLQAGADINGIGLCGRSALNVAVAEEDFDLVQFLLTAGANPNLNSESADVVNPLLVAAGRGNLEIVDTLLRGGADCNFQEISISGGEIYYSNALEKAAQGGHTNVVQHLLVASAKLNWPAEGIYGRTALQTAVECGHLELARFMIDQGADVNSPAAKDGGCTALQAAASIGDVEFVRALLTAGANAKEVPLEVAVKDGNDDVICLLLEHGADIDGPVASQTGRTALQAAAARGHCYTVELLLARGADVNAPARLVNGMTALQAAARAGNIHIADILLKAGASVNARGSTGLGLGTAFQVAAGAGRIDMLKLLLNAGADITSNFGRHQLKIGLEEATLSGHNAAAKFLKYHQI
jgi:ankyrin repeat protein